MNQMPQSDLLMEFKLGCGFQNQKGILKATRNGKRGFLIGLLSLSQIKFSSSNLFQQFFP